MFIIRRAKTTLGVRWVSEGIVRVEMGVVDLHGGRVGVG